MSMFIEVVPILFFETDVQKQGLEIMIGDYDSEYRQKNDREQIDE